MPWTKGQSGNPKGRPKGAKAKRSILQERAAEVAKQYGLTPLDYLMSIVQDPTETKANRLDAAKAALPYVHQKLPTKLEHSGELSLADILTGLTRGAGKEDPGLEDQASPVH